ncbi:hypothetical protein PsorP6_009187 [Peronosclerospora sorghi]|uniref:Uncharacterized protein n=1 Tax=Peronosclerospora sorghi TaxID=230839 RepID=A0ACC0W092_9STRA|nr:hypothetical protein PsorP6_009187 [Peronosclerospora sorghi]
MFLDNRKRQYMFRKLSSYGDTPVRTVWRDTVCSPNVASALRALCGSPPPRGLSLLVASKRDPWTTTAGSDPCDPGRRQLLCLSNSTNSIYLRMGTIEMPDQDATLHCVATVLSSHLASASSRPPVPLLPCLCPHAGPPSVHKLATFIKRILKLAKTDAECTIMTLVALRGSALSFITALGGKTRLLNRSRSNSFGLPEKRGGSLVLWVLRFSRGGHLELDVKLNGSYTVHRN